MGWGFAFALGLILVFYLLYINGLLIFSAKTAAIFAGYVRRNGNAQLRFAACSGRIKRVIRFRDPGDLPFYISFGNIRWNGCGKGSGCKKAEVISCMGTNYETKLESRKGKEVYLVFSVQKCDGEMQRDLEMKKGLKRWNIS